MSYSVHSLSWIIVVLTFIKGKATCITLRLIGLERNDEAPALHTPVAYLCLGPESESPVNQTEVIRNCLHRRRAIVCPDGEYIPPKVLPAQRHSTRSEIPSQIKSPFSF